MKINRFIALGLIVVIAIITLSMFGVRALAQTPDPATPSGPQDEQEGGAEGSEDAAEGPDVPIKSPDLERASAAALAYLGQGSVTGTEVGDEEGYYEVEVTLDDGSQVDVHLDENFNVLSQIGDGEGH